MSKDTFNFRELHGDCPSLLIGRMDLGVTKELLPTHHKIHLGLQCLKFIKFPFELKIQNLFKMIRKTCRITIAYYLTAQNNLSDYKLSFSKSPREWYIILGRYGFVEEKNKNSWIIDGRRGSKYKNSIC